jgi:hypothetical protein
MPSSFTNLAMARAAGRLPLVRNLPLARLVILAEVAILAKDHFEHLEPAERRRLVVLVRGAKGRPSNLGARERRELEDLIAKIDPKAFASHAAQRFSPLPSRRSSSR